MPHTADNAVSRAFVDQLATMSPVIGTGLGLTEAAGWCTYVLASTAERDSSNQEAILAGLGVDMPIYPCTHSPAHARGWLRGR